jgi:hypothetical protein
MPDYNINHRVNRIKQPDSNSCWAACLIMKLESAGRRCYTINGIKTIAAENGVTLHANGSVATDRANMDKLASAFNIRILQNAGTVQISHLVPILQKSPIILFGGFNYSGNSTPMNHAVIMHQLFGDGSDDTGLALIDPQNTVPGTDPASDYVCSWRDLRTQVINRLDYVSALN